MIRWSISSLINTAINFHRKYEVKRSHVDFVESLPDNLSSGPNLSSSQPQTQLGFVDFVD